MNTKFIPTITIVMPTYNHANFLGKALQSLIDQTYKEWEVIIIDNHSTDSTDEVIKKFNDPRIRNYKITNHGILAKSRNLGIKVSRGNWIAFLDSDDWWTADKLEVCFKEMNDKVDLMYHNLQVIYQSKLSSKKIYKGRKLYNPILNDLLISGIKYGNAIAQSSVIVRKSLLLKIGGIDENINLVGSEDYNTWLRIAEITDQFKYLNKNLGYILIHENNVSNKDMSTPQRQAVLKYMKLLNHKQKINLEVKFNYISGSYKFLNNDINAKENLIYVMKYGEIILKIKSLIKFLILIFKKR